MALQTDHSTSLANLDIALALIDRIDEAYRIADPDAHLMFNQAIFERTWIDREQVTNTKLASPIKENA